MPALDACGTPYVLVSDPAQDFVIVSGDQIEIFSTNALFDSYTV